MLTVALTGRLITLHRRFVATQITTPVTWVVPSEGMLPPDLTVRLTDDPTAFEPAPPVPSATWKAVPKTSDALDTALQDGLAEAYGFVVGYTDAMHEICRRVRAVAHPMARLLGMRVLIVGETGVGKELVARGIHRLGPGREDPFIAVNCAAIPRDLAASELFGHVRGAFTNAVQHRHGAFERAKGGVVFLDEVGDLPLEVQTQLLRAVEERSVTPVGGSESITVAAQVVSATNRQLGELVEQRAFRADLYFRLAQMTIAVPELRHRAPDLDLLVRHFWRTVANSDNVDSLLREAVQGRSWPGNVRELRAVVEKFLLLRAAGVDPSAELQLPAESARRTIGALAMSQADYERKIVVAVLERTKWNMDAAAKELGVTRRTVYNLIRRHGIGRNP
jgi:transcriptional regulator with GAF, ATPase, and Fis domain